jgi:ComF family protein
MPISFWQRSLSLLLPSTCLACRSDLPERPSAPDLGLCDGCHQSVRWRTSLEFQFDEHLEALYATAEFAGALRETIVHFKYHRRDFLAEDLAQKWLCRSPYDSDDYSIVVAVPLAPLKSLVRGYNPAGEIAKIIAREQGKAWSDAVIRRGIFTTSQTKKNKRDRFRNAEHGFRAGSSMSIVKGKSVLLVDDVCTTGATLRVCARLRRSAGARRVWGAALARDVLA